ncbi:hypothetical protein [Nocardioides sp. GY 10127]|uniref:hypothetical protein n=1 Tax=Nocardioides sp. GY 10127 TaxID=2569762 RepID=UPI0010A8B2DC|nr:hypothetical protein [Nocardioides sp. GY 10127]TIC78767.1 hypothetical protein E8D37_18905 [Nocardioides sp. GY 10127]
MPLLWQQLAATPVGSIRYFHLGALAMLAIARPIQGIYFALWGRILPAAVAVVVHTILMTLSAMAWAGYWPDPIQNALYALLGIFAGACFFTALTEAPARRLMAMASPAVTTTFVLAFGQAIIAAGLNPISVYRAALAGDRQILLFALYRGAFSSGGGEEVLSMTRHEMYGALFIAACVSGMTIWSLRSALTRAVVVASQLITLALIATSLSRSVMIAVAITGMVAAAGLLGRIKVPIAVAALAGVAVLAFPLYAPALQQLVLDHFLDDTTSYEGRAGSWSAFSQPDIWNRLFFGGGPLTISTHTMVGDAALRGGLLAAVAAVVFCLTLIRRWFSALGLVMAGDSAAIGCAGALGIALVRCFTSGGGFLAFAQWQAIGMGIAFLLWRETSRRQSAIQTQVGAAE